MAALPLTLDQSFPGMNATQGQYVGAPSAGLSGTYTSGNSVSPEAGYAAGIATNVNGQTPFYGPSNIYGPTASQYNPNINKTTNSLPNNPAPTNNPTPPPGGNNPPPDSQLTQLHKIAQSGGLNPYQQGQLDALLSQQTSAAQSAYGAQNASLNTQFDQSAANLNAQLPFLQQQRDSSLSDLNTANQQSVDQANHARLSAQTNTEDQINQAGDVAHQTQNQNRNILRALGIGGGSYAAELLSKPLNTYDQQRGQLNTALQQRSQQLDDYLNNVTQQHASAVSQLQNNYANLVGKIQSDLRFNDRQRNDALQSANAALQTNLANIQSSAQQYAQQVQLMKMQLSQGAGAVTNYANPTADLGAIQNTGLSNDQAGQTQSANIIQKKNLTNANQPFQTLSGGGLLA